MKTHHLILTALAGLAVTLAPLAAWAGDSDTESLIKGAQEAKAAFRKTDPSMDRLFTEAAGYAVFPRIDKGAFFVGGAGGHGVLFVNGQAVGKTKMTQITVGLQAGGQAYSEIIFFKDQRALDDFKQGRAELSAQASAVAASKGASANARYENGVAVFTSTIGGLMYEASVGGQKFDFQPFESVPRT